MRGELSAAYEAHMQIPASDVGGFIPGTTTYYAYDRATNTYWALAQFRPSASAPLKVEVSFQDNGDVGMFRRAGLGPWQTHGAGVPLGCAEVKFFAQPVLRAWSLPTSTPGLTC
jgi:hypothetical protein